MKKILHFAAALACGLCLMGTAARAEEGASPALQQPQELRAVYLAPGRDFDPAASEEDCRAQLEAAFSQAAEYGMNAVFLPVNTASGALFASEHWPMATGFDLLGCAQQEAAAKELYLYPVFDAAFGLQTGGGYGPHSALSAAAVQSACQVLAALTARYQPNGVYLAGYYNHKDAGSMSLYRAEGASMGYENWVRECVTSLVVNASQAVKGQRGEAVFGLMADPVWANVASDPAGSATSASFEMLTGGFVDLNAIFTWSSIDQVLVRCPGSLADENAAFGTVLSWWAGVAQQHGASVAAYIYNDKLGGDEAGWKAPDQVMRQVIQTREIPGCGGGGVRLAAPPAGKHRRLHGRAAALLCRPDRGERHPDRSLGEHA